MKKITCRQVALVSALCFSVFPAIAEGASGFASSIVAKNSGLCLDIPGSSSNVGLAVEQWSCNEGSNQDFLFMPTATAGAYTIQAVNDSLCLDVSSSGAIVQDACSGKASQVFLLTPTANAYEYYVKTSSGKCMNVSGNSSASGGKIIQYACSDVSNEHFEIEVATRIAVIAPSGSTSVPLNEYQSVEGMRSDATGLAYDLGYVEASGDVVYDLSVDQAGSYEVNLSYSSPSGGTGVNVLVNEKSAGSVEFGKTGAWSVYKSAAALAVDLPAGPVQLEIQAEKAGFNLGGVSIVALPHLAPSPSPSPVVVAPPAPSPSSSPSPSPSPVVVASSPNWVSYLPGGLNLKPGESVQLNGVSLQFTQNANMEVVSAAGNVLYQTNTNANCATGNCDLTFQSDGNFVIYAPSGAIWSAGTYDNNEGFMVFQNQPPYIRIMNQGFTVHWNTSSGSGVLAQSANAFLSSMGINTHMQQGYSATQYIPMLQYTGIRNVRDGAMDPSTYLSVHQQTGAKFNILSYGNLSEMVSCGTSLAAAGALSSLEGSNEPNNFSFTYDGEPTGGSHSWQGVADYQRDLYSAVKGSAALASYPVYGVSEDGAESADWGLQFLTIPLGSNLLMPDNTHYSDYVNVHNYVSGHNSSYYGDNMAWNAASPTLNGDWDGLDVEEGTTWYGHYAGYSNAELMGLPRVTTETGWDSAGNPGGPVVQGVVLTNTYLAQFKQGWTQTYIYEMVDGQGSSGNQGIYTSSSVAKPAANYIHNLTTILADSAGSSSFSTLNYSISNQGSTVHDLLLQKSSGLYELIVWDERASSTTDSVTVSLGSEVASVNVYDVTVGTSPVQTLTNVSSVPLTLNNHAMILEFK